VSAHTIYVTVGADQQFRLVPDSWHGVWWFELQGYTGGPMSPGSPVSLLIYADKHHPEAHRLWDAVAAFNAVMDGEVTPPAILKPTLQEMHTTPMTHKEPSK